ncbi:diguanylate cyclase, partial [Actinomycetota bacterium]
RIRLFVAIGSLSWFVSKFLELGFVDTEIKIFWSKVQITSIFIFSIALFIFSLYYSGREKWLSKLGMTMLWVIPVISAILLFNNKLHAYIFNNINIREIDSLLVLERGYGPWYWIIMSYILVLLIFSIVFLNIINRRSNYKYQRKALISILMLILCPAIIAVLSFFNYKPYPYLDIMPLTLAAGCLIISITLYRVEDGEIIDVNNSSIIDSIDDGVILLDKNNSVLYMNKAFQDYFNINPNGAIGKNMELVFPVLDIRMKSFNHQSNGHKQLKTFYLDGRTYDLNVFNLFDLIKRYAGKTIILRDITEKKVTENILRESEEKFRLLFEKSSDGIFNYNISNGKIDFNPALFKIFGYSTIREVNNDYIKEILEIINEENPNSSNEKNFLQKQIERENGSKIWIEVSFNKDINHSGDIICNGIVRDITSKKVFENKIKYLSFHDKLTGLYNRAFFEAELKRLNKKRQLPLTIVIADIDGLKLINDAFGHENGDKLIKKIAGIFKYCFRSEDIIARYGGDEFAILLPSTPMREVLKIIERIKIACKKEGNKILPLNISIGVSSKTEISQEINSVIKDADDQMYKNKLMKKQNPQSSLIFSLEKALEERNFETVEHVRRMRDGVTSLGKELEFQDDTINDLRLLSTLHDIGKIGISDNIILKPDKLSYREWRVIKKHSEIGFRIAKSSKELSTIAKSILHHHEWWNGKGYPSKLKGEEIPINSRIVSIVDAFDAMTNNRPYRKAVTKEQAILELKKCSGIQFDPFLIKKFVNIC